MTDKIITKMPIPCRKFYKGKTTPQEICEVGIDKIGEEYLEVQKAAYDWVENKNIEYKFALAEELTDIITAATSWLDAIGYDAEERANIQEYVNKKNERRGYHE